MPWQLGSQFKSLCHTRASSGSSRDPVLGPGSCWRRHCAPASSLVTWLFLSSHAGEISWGSFRQGDRLCVHLGPQPDSSPPPHSLFQKPHFMVNRGAPRSPFLPAPTGVSQYRGPSHRELQAGGPPRPRTQASPSQPGRTHHNKCAVRGQPGLCRHAFRPLSCLAPVVFACLSTCSFIYRRLHANTAHPSSVLGTVPWLHE